VVTLQERLRAKPILAAPGVFDPLSALIAEQAGCEAVFVSGAALAMTQLASPDCGLNSVTELADMIARITDRVQIPVLVDGDSGYGNAANLQRLVRMLCRAGASAVQIEDQVAVKPAGAIRARPLVPVSTMVGKIKAAQDARLDESFLISARTDALSTTDIDDALERADFYVDAGCDLLFVESVKEPAHIERIIARFAGRVPLVHNLLEGGGSPYASAAEADVAGFAMALFPATGLGAAARGLQRAYSAIASHGSTVAMRDQMLGMTAMNDLVGTPVFAAHIATYGDKT
jgi:2-methylisocitrate lyase-like PEP mutase family enzyme